jgi:hypothetical protein
MDKISAPVLVQKVEINYKGDKFVFNAVNCEQFIEDVNQFLNFDNLVPCKSMEHHSRLKLIRIKYPNAYTKWTKPQINLLRTLFREKFTVTKMMKELGRQRSAVNSKLEQLGLIGADNTIR